MTIIFIILPMHDIQLSTSQFVPLRIASVPCTLSGGVMTRLQVSAGGLLVAQTAWSLTAARCPRFECRRRRHFPLCLRDGHIKRGAHISVSPRSRVVRSLQQACSYGSGGMLGTTERNASSWMRLCSSDRSAAAASGRPMGNEAAISPICFTFLS